LEWLFFHAVWSGKIPGGIMGDKFILAHDLGTTGNKASLYGEGGEALASIFYGYSTEYPRPNWVEQNPEDWWQAVCTSTRQLLETTHLPSESIACIVFSGQMMGCVPVDVQARPLRSAIIWADTRAAEQAQLLVDRVGMAETYTITGHRASPSYSGAKFAWVRDRQPEIYAQTHKFLLAKDFVAARLTGKFVTDFSDASGMNLLDLKKREWSPELVQALQLDPDKLPELHPSTDVIGEVTSQAAEATGLAVGTPVVIGGGDGPCAAVGAGVVRPGSAYNYIGSSAWIGIATPDPIYDPAMRTNTFCHLVPGLVTPTGSMQAAGGAYQWLRDVFCLPEVLSAEQIKVSPYELMNLQAERSKPGSNGLLFLPYLLGERSPYWNPDARGAFLGLTMGHGRADMIRAVLEGVALNLCIILRAFQEQGARVETMRVIGGGARGRIWRQIMADIYGIPVARPALLSEATSLGAALCGGVGVGLFTDFNIAEELTPVVDWIEPDPGLRNLYDQLYEIFCRAYAAFEPLFGDLVRIGG
jgi:xylulokinase